MNAARVTRICCLLAALLPGIPAHAADPAPAAPPATVRMLQIPSPSPGASPVAVFRKLFAMTPEERERFLTNYPPAKRERIQAKLLEYQLLPPEYREQRLQVTELRWYLLPLMPLPRTQREEQLKQIPEPSRQMVAARLEEWDIWPPALKDEVLDYESTMHYFVGKDYKVQLQPAADDLPDWQRSELNRKLRRWEALPLAQRQQLYDRFQHYFELNDPEKQRIMDSLTEPERQEITEALGPMEKWPKSQQDRYLSAFRQFAEMSTVERQQFMRNLARWEQMSPEERQAWRDLVQQLDILPPGLAPAPTGSGTPDRTNPTAAPSR